MTSDSQKAQCSAPAPFLTDRGPLILGTGSGIVLTISTGEIASESWRSKLPPALNVTAEESRSPRGGFTVSTTSCRSAG